VVEEAKEPRAHPEAGSDVELTFVIPYYNPGPAFGGVVAQVSGELSKTGLTFEVIAVSDGSTDGSDSSVEARAALAAPGVRKLALTNHQGKGGALRAGLEQGRGRYLGFIDADGDLPAALLGDFVSAIRRGDVDIVAGSKRHPASEVAYPLLRRMYSWGFQQLSALLFGLRVRDTQTGLKVVRREVLEAVLPHMVEKRYVFDLELLVLARELGFDRLSELPVRIERKFGSTISPLAVAGILIDTLALWWRLRVRRSYVGLGNRPGS
jgi:glycosyltransferase involved in cell wall biosynthesis